MNNRVPAGIELVLAAVCVLGAWWCWDHGVHATSFGAADGVPAYASTSYSGGWIFGAAVLIIVAAAFLIDMVRRLWTSSRIPSGGILE